MRVCVGARSPRARHAPVLLVLLLSPVAGLTCPKDTYPHGGRCCSECRPGFGMESRCNRYRDTVCRPCEQGFYNERVNYESCKSCTRCNARSGSEPRQNCTPIRDTVCRCRAGTQPQGGFRTGVDCVPCPPGHFSGGNNQACRPWTDCASVGRRTLQPGSSSLDVVCEAPRAPATAAGSTPRPSSQPTSARPTCVQPSTALAEPPRGPTPAAGLGLGLGLLLPATALGLLLHRWARRPLPAPAPTSCLPPHPDSSPGGNGFRTPIQEEHTDGHSTLAKT
ncbi:tumor necrosis factor receptor superfamily member 4 [Tamandua tetradactyla]|uniref:tumor necrosis factor receptor superfamily member 4 n=1 Tax=Tamandua tetradactyla TaxID=48850 RepID=UPI004053F988